MISLDAIQKELQNRQRSFENREDQKITWYKLPREGTAKIIFLPPTENAQYPGTIQYTHWGIPEVKYLTCLKTFKKTCPLCEKLKEIQSKVPEDIFKTYTSKPRSAHHVIVLDNPEYPSDKPCIMTSSSDYTFWWLLEQINNKEVGDITDPRNAYPVTFKRLTPGGRFDRMISLKSRPIAESEDKIQEILKQMIEFSKIWKYTSELESKLVIATAQVAKDLLKKTDTIKAENQIPTPSQVIDPSPNRSVTNFSSSERVTRTEETGVIQGARHSLECFGNYLGNEKCSLCSDEIDCEAISKNK